MNLWKLYDVVYDQITVVDDKHRFVRRATDEDAKNLPWTPGSTPKKDVTRQAPLAEDRDLRIQCLELAISASKTGADYGQSVPKIAQAYYLFSLGEVPPADPFAGLSFEQRLDALIQEFLRQPETGEDPAKIKHSIETVYERFLVQFPPPVLNDDPSNIGDDGRPFIPVKVPGLYPSDVQVTDAIRMKHKDIRS